MHYKLPELGPLGANGLANARDFEHPVASFEVDQGGWDITYKLLGTLWSCYQEHSPFDVVGTPSLFSSPFSNRAFADLTALLPQLGTETTFRRSTISPSSSPSVPSPAITWTPPSVRHSLRSNVEARTDLPPAQTASSPLTRRSPARLSPTSSSSVLVGTSPPAPVRPVCTFLCPLSSGTDFSFFQSVLLTSTAMPRAR